MGLFACIFMNMNWISRTGISFWNPWSASVPCATLHLCRTNLTQGTGVSFVQLKFKMCFTPFRCCKSIQNSSEPTTIFFFIFLLIPEDSHFLPSHIFRDRAVSGEPWVDRSGQHQELCSVLVPSPHHLGTSSSQLLSPCSPWEIDAGRAGKTI